MTIWWIILIFFCQPVLWVGLLRTWLSARGRIKRERKDFRSAVFSEEFEIRHFLLWGILLGIVASVISVVVGLTLPIWFIMIYEFVTLLALLLLPGVLAPVLGVSFAALLMWASNYFNFNPLDAVNLPFGLTNATANPANFLILLTLIILLTSWFLSRVGGRNPSPKIYPKRRGRLVGGYPFKELLIVPTLMLVPGDWISVHIPFWPVFNIAGHPISFLLIPILIGFRMTIFRQLPKKALQVLSRQQLLVGLLGIILSAINYFVAGIAWYSILLLFVVYCFTFIRAKWFDRHQSFWYSKTDEGVRILGIKPGTPAAKMNLVVGDIILECNHQSVTSETELYGALLLNPTYCHLRVKGHDGQFNITETAIFTDSPHEIGLVIFKDN
ncbi:PDZ domain-containing protein [Secundilactobacillus malefermentans]|uniref:PDZ domain-containing protein n=1 Tax=Secundilactobacillus malefermentans TaxID=176292 RepID=A0A4R5NDI7_9LACO|nr:PDZ domain-containing protein [Secundilactobacillus malefermentans]KRM58706.1 trypsin-like serine protease [Secundilactobacillus malefermentans DSM 5705 = KCTC 3548]QEA32047.1 PDZ domain-containing protein [Secundilactobacillus malefermentans]TDG71530.1 hypothetical protein C5L31_001747 [Secundilactobacillus malefermentans]